MGEIALKVEGLTKEYRLGTIGYGTMREDLQTWWARLRGKEDPNSLVTASHHSDSKEKHFLALDDINVEIKKGDRVGIIGRNGAGKSTLLKILSRITSPTKGNIYIDGRIGSLLEVGTGFHQELTGRENIYLNGSILGMKRREIDKKLDEIVDFAGIEKFIDTPVKRYSSGMFVRLGFAVAAHLEPEILIVDEVLAVGDLEFQKKAIGKMEEVSSKDGRTILFVSHNMSSISRLCTKGLLLDQGKVVSNGDIGYCIDQYHNFGAPNTIRTSSQYKDDKDKRIQLVSASVTDDLGDEKYLYQCDESINLNLRVCVRHKEYGDYGYLSIRNKDGLDIFVSDSNDYKQNAFDALDQGFNDISIKLPSRVLGHGEYNILLSITGIKGGNNQLDYIENICSFRLTDSKTKRADSRRGYISSILEWRMDNI